MKNRVEAFILKTQAGQWMVEVWRDGEEPIECTRRSWTPLKSLKPGRAPDGLEFVITPGRGGQPP
jgi:hypothetical protein